MPRIAALATFTLLTAAPAAAQQEIRRPGPVPHEAASATFPTRVGEFRRTRVVQYDGAGHDMSAGYELQRPEGRLNVTVYIYPPRRESPAAERAAACRQEFEANSREIRAIPIYRNVRGGPEGTAPPAAGVPADLSHRATFTFTTQFDGAERAIQSEYDLYCFVADRWLVKYRATAPAGFPVAEALATFIRTGPWPGRRPVDAVAATAAPARRAR